MKLSDFLPYSGVWIFSFGASSFVFALLLLFAGDLPEPVRRWTVPSLAVYLIGSGIIIFLKELFHIRHNAVRRQQTRNERSPENLPLGQLWIFIGIYLLWFAALIAYNIWRLVL